ncbi:MAG TPA: phage baseplate assembly protein V, partial [Ilumatobacteraceae bacterium]|nr:phage baseplate assembly protein V [Ilumatobacteraceae bacterium]
HSRVRTFTNSKYSDMVSKVATENGLQGQVTATTQSHEYLLHTGTDRALLDMIAIRTGMEWFVDDSKLVFREPESHAGTQEAILGINLIKFRARYSGASHVDKVTVRGWDYKAKDALVSVDSSSSADPDGASNPAKLGDYRRASTSVTGRDPEITTAALGVETTEEAQLIAKSIAERNAAHELSARGVMLGNPNVRAGALLKVGRVGTALSGTYYLTEVEHVFGNGDQITRFSAGGPSGDALVDLVNGTTGAIGAWAAHGFVIGVVTNIKDPDGLNRIKVKYPALSGDDESGWARLVQPMAGNEAGWVSVPAINDEVLVGFEHGDFRRPVVLGGLYNGRDAPPYPVQDGKVTKHGFKTLSQHELVFVEEQGSESITIQHGTAPGTKVVLEKEKVQVLVEGDKMVEIKAGMATMVLNEGEVTIKGKKVTIEATSGDLTLKGMNIKATAQQNFEAAANIGATVKGNATAELSASGMTTVKGATVAIN